MVESRRWQLMVSKHHPSGTLSAVAGMTNPRAPRKNTTVTRKHMASPWLCYCLRTGRQMEAAASLLPPTPLQSVRGKCEEARWSLSKRNEKTVITAIIAAELNTVAVGKRNKCVSVCLCVCVWHLFTASASCCKHTPRMPGT